MQGTPLSTIHSLELIPIVEVTAFIQLRESARIDFNGTPIPSEAIPGTITAQSTDTENGRSKTISFSRSEASSKNLDLLQYGLFVAVYTDEAGNRRVCGSPSYPLRLSYTCTGGIFSCVLTGLTTSEDPFLLPA